MKCRSGVRRIAIALVERFAGARRHKGFGEGWTMPDAGPDAGIAWPKKLREMHNHHMDSTIWDRFAFRGDDVIVATYGKSGTTWTQHIVGQLVFAGDPEVKVAEISPWLDLRIMPPNLLDLLEAQSHRRILKTHLPLDALTF